MVQAIGLSVGQGLMTIGYSLACTHRDHIAEVLEATREGELAQGLLVPNPAVSLLERSRTIAALPTALPGSFGLPEHHAQRVSSKDTQVGSVASLPACMHGRHRRTFRSSHCAPQHGCQCHGVRAGRLRHVSCSTQSGCLCLFLACYVVGYSQLTVVPSRPIKARHHALQPGHAQ